MLQEPLDLDSLEEALAGILDLDRGERRHACQAPLAASEVQGGPEIAEAELHRPPRPPRAELLRRPRLDASGGDRDHAVGAEGSAEMVHHALNVAYCLAALETAVREVGVEDLVHGRVRRCRFNERASLDFGEPLSERPLGVAWYNLPLRLPDKLGDRFSDFLSADVIHDRPRTVHPLVRAAGVGVAGVTPAPPLVLSGVTPPSPLGARQGCHDRHRWLRTAWPADRS